MTTPVDRTPGHNADETLGREPALRPDQETLVAGREEWGGWWLVPTVVLLVTVVLIVAGTLITGRGADGIGSAASGNEPVMGSPAGG